jgi:hypothetical protein
LLIIVLPLFYEIQLNHGPLIEQSMCLPLILKNLFPEKIKSTTMGALIGLLLAGNDGIEPPMRESESRALPLC